MSGFKESYFDIIVSFETIEHIEQPLLFLKTAKYLLKNNGMLILSTPNKWGITKYHKTDYDLELLKDHLNRFFCIEDIYVQNSRSEDLLVNRGAPHRIVKLDLSNKESAECFIAVCVNK